LTVPTTLTAEAFDALFRWVIRRAMLPLRKGGAQLVVVLDDEDGFDGLYKTIRDIVMGNVGRLDPSDRFRVKMLTGRAVMALLRQYPAP
jgi:hypothetical protein